MEILHDLNILLFSFFLPGTLDEKVIFSSNGNYREVFFFILFSGEDLSRLIRRSVNIFCNPRLANTWWWRQILRLRENKLMPFPKCLKFAIFRSSAIFRFMFRLMQLGGKDRTGRFIPWDKSRKRWSKCSVLTGFRGKKAFLSSIFKYTGKFDRFFAYLPERKGLPSHLHTLDFNEDG